MKEEPLHIPSYLAGFIDGEGSIGLNKELDKRKGPRYFHYRPSLQIVNTHEGVMKFIHQQLGYGDYRHVGENRRHHRGIYRVAVRNQGYLLELLKCLLPYLIIKRRQAELLVEYIEQRQNAWAKGWHKPTTARDHEIFKELRILNLRGEAAKERDLIKEAI